MSVHPAASNANALVTRMPANGTVGSAEAINNTRVVIVSAQVRYQGEKEHEQEPADDVGAELPGGIPDPGRGLPISANYASVKLLSSSEMVAMVKWAQCGEARKEPYVCHIQYEKKKGTLLTG